MLHMLHQNLIIVSAGEFGREVFSWAQQAIRAGAPWTIKGFLDDRPKILDRFSYDVPILCSAEAYVLNQDDLFLVAMGGPDAKANYCDALSRKGARFATLIHPTAVIGHNVTIGEGSIVGPLTQLSCDLRLGKHVCLGTNSNTGHDTIIGDYSHICGSCEINGCVEIGERVFVGSHATLLPRVRVGDRAFIGAGSVVLRSVKPGVKMFGNPAAAIGTVDPSGVSGTALGYNASKTGVV